MNLIKALNSINSQVWAFLVLGMGCAFVLAFHKAGIDIGIGAGIIGTALGMFTQSLKQAPDIHQPDPTPPVNPAK